MEWIDSNLDLLLLGCILLGALCVTVLFVTESPHNFTKEHDDEYEDL
jgi:hypothetical protein